MINMNEDKNEKRKTKNNRDVDDFFNHFFRNPFHQSSLDIFDIFEERIRQMHQEMNRTNQKLPRQYQDEQHDQKPLFFGWSYYQGPDGIPYYQEFTNTENLPTQTHDTAKLTSETQEPFVDVIDAEKEIYVTAEIPGVNKDTIDVELKKDTLFIKIDHPERGFTKEITLPAEVAKKPVEATYNNGILSITLKKQKKKKRGNKINIK